MATGGDASGRAIGKSIIGPCTASYAAGTVDGSCPDSVAIIEEPLRLRPAMRGDVQASLSASATVARASAGAMPMRKGARAECTPGRRAAAAAAPPSTDTAAEDGSAGERTPTAAAGGSAVDDDDVRERPMRAARELEGSCRFSQDRVGAMGACLTCMASRR